MFVNVYFFVVTLFLLPLNEAKTYFFNRNKTSNEYMIKTRLHLNDSDYYSGIRVSELRNNVTQKNITPNKPQTHHPLLLDPEWNYNWTSIKREKLPIFIYHYHDHFSTNESAPVRFLFNNMLTNSTIIRFNLSNLAYENVSSVELHFFHKIEKNFLKQSLILRLYQMDSKFFNDSYIINPDSHKLLNVIYVYQAEGGWQVFKLTNALQNWFKNKTELLLFITISKPNQEQFNFFKDINKDILRTFLVVKTESKKFGVGKNYTNVEKNCKKRSLHINFEKLHWDKFIISPSGFDAFNCFGTCYRSKSSTNHAKITSFFPEAARKSLCCAPVEYSPLPIMFYDKNRDVAIKIYEDMVISKCGCR